MSARWRTLDAAELSNYRQVQAFLDGRLLERGAIEWALSPRAQGKSERAALLDLLGGPKAADLPVPWAEAWSLIRDGLDDDSTDDDQLEAYEVLDRLNKGERSAQLISMIARVATPRLAVSPRRRYASDDHGKKHPALDDLLVAELNTPTIPKELRSALTALDDATFMERLTLELELALRKGLEIGHRIGWTEQFGMWRLGGLTSVFYVPPEQLADAELEPDDYHHGIAPVVKLLHLVVSRLGALSPVNALEVVRRWETSDIAVFRRLWAAVGLIPSVIDAPSVARFLLGTTPSEFWDARSYPEVALLRATRLMDVDDQARRKIIQRTRAMPPRHIWPRDANRDAVARSREYWAARELRRIEVGGSSLSDKSEQWLKLRLTMFPEVASMSAPYDQLFDYVPSRPTRNSIDHSFDLLEGDQLLQALERSLSTNTDSWDDGPSGRANSWIQANVLVTLDLVANARAGGADYPSIWERLGWAHSPKDVSDGHESSMGAQAALVLRLLEELPKRTIAVAIQGISAWLSRWEREIAGLPTAQRVWLRVWPLAVESTNATRAAGSEDEFDLTTLGRAEGDEPADIDTLNSPVGKLVGVFFVFCPNLQTTPQPFAPRSRLRRMRDVIVRAEGRSGLIARRRLVEVLLYLIKADQEWTQKHLIEPLYEDDDQAVILWRGIARRTQFEGVLSVIGDGVLVRVNDVRLGRRSRSSLGFSLVVECLRASLAGRDPAVSPVEVQQSLRLVDDEVRAGAADGVLRFVVDHTREGATNRPEVLFAKAVAPFLMNVWPQERALATPGVSKTFAKLPAALGKKFAAAVAVVERFLVPFQCWSLHDYGLVSQGGDSLSVISTAEAGEAALTLFSRTIGVTDGAVIPRDLAAALDKVASLSSKLTADPRYRRLRTLVRRM